MDSLSPSLTRHILGKLEDVQDLANFASVCRTFSAILWPKLLFQKSFAMVKGGLQSRHMASLEELYLPVSMIKGIELKSLIERSSSSLEVVHFACAGAFEGELWSFLEGFPKLSSITLGYSRYDGSPGCSFPSLKSVTLSLGKTGEYDIQNLLNSAPLLETLILSIHGVVSEGHRVTIERGCNLRTLDLLVSDANLRITGCDRLEALTVQCARSVEFGSEIFSSRLRKFGWGCVKTPLDSLPLSEFLPNVEHLDIFTCRFSEGFDTLVIPGDNLKVLKYASKVGKLRVDHCERLEELDVSGPKVFELGSSCPRLEKAWLDWNLDNEQLSELLAKSPRLKKLKLKLCSLLESPITLSSSSLQKLSFSGQSDEPTTLKIDCKAFKKLHVDYDCLVEPDSIIPSLSLNWMEKEENLLRLAELPFVANLVHLRLNLIKTLEEQCLIAAAFLPRSKQLTTITLDSFWKDENITSDFDKALKQLSTNASFLSCPRLQRICLKSWISVKELKTGSLERLEKLKETVKRIEIPGFTCKVTAKNSYYSYQVDVFRC